MFSSTANEPKNANKDKIIKYVQLILSFANRRPTEWQSVNAMSLGLASTYQLYPPQALTDNSTEENDELDGCEHESIPFFQTLPHPSPC
jgi:hypothetical protein